MIIADTSIWVNHIRGRDTPLSSLLGVAPVLLHPFVHGELLLHGLPRRGPFAKALEELDLAPLASTDEVAAFIVWADLKGTGIGYVDAHLLVSARISAGKILTVDKKLHAQANRLDLG